MLEPNNSVAYHACPSRLISSIHPFIFLITPYLGFYLSPECLLNSLCFSPCVRKTLRVLVFKFLENALNLCIFTHAPVPYLKLQVEFVRKSISPKMKGVEETAICCFRIQSESMKMTWNNIYILYFL